MQTKEEAIARVVEHANKEWREEALLVVMELASHRLNFTTDDVWPRIPGYAHTHEARAMGAIMKTAHKNGWVTPTDRFIGSTSLVNHKRPLRVWESALLHKGTMGGRQIRTRQTCEACKGRGFFSHNVEGDCLDFVTCDVCRGAGVA